MKTSSPLSESQFLAPLQLESGIGELLSLDIDESHHAVKVFRHRVGDRLRLGNGAGIQGVGVVIEANSERCVVQVEDVFSLQTCPRIHLAIAALKDNDLEEVMESCGQLPLASLTLLRTDHSQEPRDSDLKRTIRRLELKSMVAFKQSLKPWLTSVHGPVPFSSWIFQNSSQILLCDMEGSVTLPHSNLQDPTTPPLTLLIGPEGGFSDAEMTAARAKNALLLRLGSTRLRAKTCPAIALGALIGMGCRF
jgi:16S rRNA (uracil1498-N3)-methyltransferase